MWYDVTGYEEGIEYQILDTTNETHIKVSAACTLLCIPALAGLYSAVFRCTWESPHLCATACAFRLRQSLLLWLTACKRSAGWR